MDNHKIVDKIYEYDNYRFFLTDFFQEQKAEKKGFTHRSFAKKAGFSSSSFFTHVTHGERNLTDSSLEKMLKGVGLRGRRATFFRTLVFYNQAETLEDREKLYDKLNKIRQSSELFDVSQTQWHYYDNWYNPVIRELAVSSDWGDDFKKLGEMVTPVITPERARKSVELLVEIGMLRTREQGYELCNEVVSARTVPAVVTRQMRRKFIQLAEEAMENLPIEERLIASATVSLNEEQYRQVEQKLNDIREHILKDVATSEDSGRVYQINMQAFPLSKEANFGSEGEQNA